MKRTPRPFPFIKNRGESFSQRSTPTKRAQLYFSDSDSESSGNIQVIDVVRPNLTRKLQLSSDNYSSTYSSTQYSDAPSTEIDWNSKNKPPQSPERIINDDPSFFINKSDSDKNEFKQIDTQDDKQASDIISPNFISQQTPETEKCTESQNFETNKTSNDQIDNVPPDIFNLFDQNSQNERSFIVHRKKKRSKFASLVDFHGKEIYWSSVKTMNKKFDITIYSDKDFIAYMRSTNKNSSITLYTNLLKDDRDDREGEIMYIDNMRPISSNSSPFTVILPNNSEINYPITERLALRQIYRNNSDNKIIILESIPFQEKFIRRFSVKSRRNFILVNKETQNQAMIFYKCAKDLFQMDINIPLEPLRAFALAIAMFNAK